MATFAMAFVMFFGVGFGAVVAMLAFPVLVEARPTVAAVCVVGMLLLFATDIAVTVCRGRR